MAKKPLPEHWLLPFMPFAVQFVTVLARSWLGTVIVVGLAVTLICIRDTTTIADVNLDVRAGVSPGSGKEVKARAAPPER